MNTFVNNSNLILIILSLVWILPWKTYALWTSAKKGHKVWFIIMLIFNTFAILEIVYTFYIAKKTPKDIMKIFRIKSKKIKENSDEQK